MTTHPDGPTAPSVRVLTDCHALLAGLQTPGERTTRMLRRAIERKKRILVTAGAFGICVIVLGACTDTSLETHSASADRTAPAYTVQTATGMSWKIGIMSLAPPPTNTSPAVSASQAYGAFQSSYYYDYFATKGYASPHLEYGLYTDLEYGTRNLDGSITPFYDQRPCWIVLYLGVDYQNPTTLGPAVPDTDRTSNSTSTTIQTSIARQRDIVIVIDATTGKALDAKVVPTTSRDATYVPATSANTTPLS